MTDTSQHTSSELFTLISKGNDQAFRELFDLYKAKLYFFVLHIISQEAGSEELVQDLFLRIWTSRHTLGNVSNPDAYIFTMAKNRSLDYIQKMAKERKMKEVLTGRNDFSENTTEEHIDLNESKRMINSAVSQLPCQQELVFRLSKEQGLKRHEIARHLNISENTVKNHLAESIHFIKRYLRQHGVEALLFLSWYYL